MQKACYRSLAHFGLLVINFLIDVKNIDDYDEKLNFRGGL